MKKKIIQIMCLLLLSVLVQTAVAQQKKEFYMTAIKPGVLDLIDHSARTLTVDGKSFKFDIDPDKASLDKSEIKDTEVNPRDLKVGMRYFFVYYSKEDISDNEKTTIIFIASRDPSGLG